MDIPRVFMALNPNATFINNEVNFFSLETIAKTYQGNMPSQTDMDTEWTIIQANDLEIKRVGDIQAEAQTRIIAQLPQGRPDNFIIKELNLLMSNAELDEIRYGRPLTVEEQTKKDEFINMKDKIKLIRSMSDDAEISGDSLIDFQTALDLAGL